MGYRLADWQCVKCGSRVEDIVWVVHGKRLPRHIEHHCGVCKKSTRHDRLMGAPAPYMGERVCNPFMHGGSCDTMGSQEYERLPDLPGAQEHAEKLRQRMRALPAGARAEERKHAFHDACRDAPSSADYAALFATPEWQETYRRNQRIGQNNVEKRKRAAALRHGQNINFKRDRCKGDPKITA